MIGWSTRYCWPTRKSSSTICIAAWGTARSLGRLLEQDKVVKAMEQVLEEGKRFDEELTKLAEDELSPQMLSDEDDGDEETEEDGGDGRRQSGRAGGRGTRCSR